MIAYQPMNTDAPTISKNGSTFNEAEESQQQYPFQLCPECMSEHTEVVKLLRSDTESVKSPTGFHRPFKRGVFKVSLNLMLWSAIQTRVAKAKAGAVNQ